MSKRARDVLWVSSSAVDADLGILSTFLWGPVKGTKPPAHSAVRDAIVRLLLNRQDALGLVANRVALLFDPALNQPLPEPRHKVVFAPTRQRPVDHQRNAVIWRVLEIASSKKGWKTQMVAKLATEYGLDTRTIERIYKEYKEYGGRLYRQP